MDKLFSVVGFATDAKGTTKIRWANDLKARTKAFKQHKFTDIMLIDLGEQVNKTEAVKRMVNNEAFDDPYYQDYIKDYLDNKAEVGLYETIRAQAEIMESDEEFEEDFEEESIESSNEASLDEALDMIAPQEEEVAEAEEYEDSAVETA